MLCQAHIGLDITWDTDIPWDSELKDTVPVLKGQVWCAVQVHGGGCMSKGKGTEHILGVLGWLPGEGGP